MSETLGSFDKSTEASIMTQSLLDEVLRRIIEAVQPERIILFGSAARGDAGLASVIDLLVIKAGVLHRRRLAR